MIWLAFIGCMMVSFFLTDAIRRFALSRDLLNLPNERSSHTIATPQGGGLAILVSFLLALMALTLGEKMPYSSLWFFLVFGGSIAVLGLLDDFFHVAARWRILVHFLVAGLALIWLGGLPPILLAGQILDLGWIGHLLSLLYLVWLLNLYNFMDGIDGIAGIEAITVCCGGLIVHATLGPGDAMTVELILMIAATAGFLAWNFPKAKIFMGDTGSAFIGFVLGLFSIQASSQSPGLIWAWIILLGCFIVDATITLIRRVMRGEKFYLAHRSHAYQYAARKYSSHALVSTVFGLINLIWLLPLALLAASGWLDGLILLAIAYAPLVYLCFVFKAGAREQQAV